jgi:hypothetical protein
MPVQGRLSMPTFSGKEREMMGRVGRKTVLGILAAGVMLLGCFVPVIYGVYKVYDLGRQQVIALRIMEEPENVYKASIAVADERGVKITNRKDKELFLSAITRGGQGADVKVSSLPKGGSLLTITVEKGKDPKAERQDIVNAVLSVCSKFGTQCSEEKEK